MSNFRFLPFEVKFSDESLRKALEDPNSKKIAEDIQILKAGTFHHPQYGKIDVTTELMETMVRNFNEGVRNIELAVDYEHNSNGIAAGWFKSLYLSEDKQELWAQVEWTPKALRKLAEKEFRYVSADFNTNYQDNETLQEFGPTLMGAGLTNRPFVKGMTAAVALSEHKIGEEQMTLDEAKKKIADLETENKKLSEGVAKLEELEMSPEEMMAEIKMLREKLKGMEDSQAKLQEEKMLAEKKGQFDKMLAEGKVVEAQRDAFMEDNTVKFAELAGEVNLKGKGTNGGKKDDDVTDPEGQVLSLAEAMMKEKKISCADAISVVLSENPKLREAYEANTAV